MSATYKKKKKKKTKKTKNTLYQPGRQLLKHGATPRLTELDERASCDI
jgi:hypothetical protein